VGHGVSYSGRRVVVGLLLEREVVQGGVSHQFGLICCSESGHGVSPHTEVLGYVVRLDEMGDDVGGVGDLDMRVCVMGYVAVGDGQVPAGLARRISGGHWQHY
jgi:hypothetical protein